MTRYQFAAFLSILWYMLMIFIVICFFCGYRGIWIGLPMGGMVALSIVEIRTRWDDLS